MPSRKLRLTVKIDIMCNSDSFKNKQSVLNSFTRYIISTINFGDQFLAFNSLQYMTCDKLYYYYYAATTTTTMNRSLRII